MIKIICLNGPAGCGKDTIGALLATRLPGRVKIEKFAQPIRGAALATFPGVTEENFEEMKKSSMFGDGPALRKWMIGFSEDLMKPLYGKPIFGILLLDRLQRAKVKADFVIITDCGFFEEARVLESYFGPENLILFRIFRKETTFDGDSRNYVYGLENIQEVTNLEGDPSRAADLILKHLRYAGMLER